MTTFWFWSLALHALTLAFLIRSPSPVWTPPPERVEVEFTAADELSPAKTNARATPPVPRPERQIVEQEHRLNDEVDANTRFLSAFDQKVRRETRAAQSGKFNNALHGGQKSAGEAARATRDRKTASKSRQAPPGEVPSLADLLPKYEARTMAAAAADGSDQPPGDPTQTDDYLRDVQPGLQTLISTREFVYYAYYNRIKAALRSHWEPDVRERVNLVLRQGRQLASARDRVTQVVVTLDARGELINVDVITQSGVADLDDAAVSAFRQAAPFPNPPKGMLEVDGTVKIRWDFVLEV